MAPFIAFFRLIRWQNLLFIALTQYLFYFCIVNPHLNAYYLSLPKSINLFIVHLLVVASVLIAAAGYIINDYFDVNIDQVNKPHQTIIDTHISRRWAIVFHFLFSTVGVFISFYISLKTTWIVLIANIICTVLLWLYSTTFKKKLLSGNILISILTAWTILVVYFAANTTSIYQIIRHRELLVSMQGIFKFTVLYSGFAFIISIIREVIKDMEDMQGDEKYGCTTMPIVWGVPATKVYAGVWLIVLICAVTIVQLYALLLGWWLSALYSFALVVFPLIHTVVNLYRASTPAQYHKLSSTIKWIMLAGILSMLPVYLMK